MLLAVCAYRTRLAIWHPTSPFQDMLQKWNEGYYGGSCTPLMYIPGHTEYHMKLPSTFPHHNPSKTCHNISIKAKCKGKGFEVRIIIYIGTNGV